MPKATRRKTQNATAKQTESPEAQNRLEGRQIILAAFLSAILLWLSYSPIGTGYLGWLAPIGWLTVVVSQQSLSRKNYVWLWLSGCVFWLVTLQGIRLAYWPLYFGWIALSLYLAVYIPLFVWTARRLAERGIPVWLATPISWVAFEYARSYMLTGYCANALGHSQARFPILIQIADQLGVYGVSFCMMLVTTCVLLCIQELRERGKGTGAVSLRFAACVSAALLTLTAQIGYGAWRLKEADELAKQAPLLRVGLIQENTPTMFDMPNDEGKSIKAAWLRYQNATQELAAQASPIDLFVWPESTFTASAPWVTPSKLQELPDRVTGSQVEKESFLSWHRKIRGEFEFKADLLLTAINLVSEFDGQLLVGCDIISYETGESMFFNGAILVDAEGQPVDDYRKMHRVMFGEYLPLGPLLQWLRDMFGLILDAGKEPKCFDINGVAVSPNICFESMMPRIISGQVRKLTRDGKSPQVLVNLTNDSWFHGSSMLKHHLDSTILCSVENRRPILVAANSGFSAEIDGSGRLIQTLGIYARGGLVAEPRSDSRWGIVQSFGYPLGIMCALIALFALSPRRREDVSHTEHPNTSTQ